jgi:hypothetical protein
MPTGFRPGRRAGGPLVADRVVRLSQITPSAGLQPLSGRKIRSSHPACRPPWLCYAQMRPNQMQVRLAKPVRLQVVFGAIVIVMEPVERLAHG